MKYLLKGTVVTQNDRSDVFDGFICIKNDLIISMGFSRNDLPEGFKNVEAIETDGYIYPGLIDLHNHLPFNYLSLWRIDKKFEDRYQWPTSNRYKFEIALPTNLLAIINGPELVKYCETKSLIGGVTTIDGFSKFRGSYAAWILRNVEVEPFGKSKPPIYQSVLQLKPEDLEALSKKMADSSAFIYHLAEGTRKTLHKEFGDLKSNNMLGDRLVAIHCTALQAKHLQGFAQAHARMVWSPLSNILLYGTSAKVSYAKKKGILICLGPDWTPTGSKNLLWELKVADLVNRNSLRRLFSNKELVDMVTINPAKAIRWDDKLGKLAPNYLADLVITEKIAKDPYKNLINATEENIRLVTINGKPRFGDPKVFESLGIIDYEKITINSKTKALDIREPNAQFGDLTLEEVKSSLTKTLEDPKKAANDYLNRPPPTMFGEAARPELIIEDEGIISDLPFSGLNDSFGAASATSVLNQVINLKESELALIPRKLDPLTMYENTEKFFETMKNNKNVYKYLYKLKNYLH